MLKKNLAVIIFILFAAQPVMDVISFWLDKLGMSTAPSLLLRMLVLVCTALIGFILSKKRKYYWYLAAICVGFFILHAIACFIAGYISPFADLTNYIRVIQIPLFALCFVTFMKTDPRAFRWIGVGIMIAFGIVTVVVLASVITNTNPYTYADVQMGILGWFSTTNSQASIVSMMTPILLCMAYRAKPLWIFVLTVVLTCGQLYFLGTRLAYFAIFVSVFGLIFISVICGNTNRSKYAILIVAALVCAVFVKQSPMYRHQMTYAQSVQEKQSVLNSMSAERGATVTEAEKEEAKVDNSKLPLIRSMNQVYVYYTSSMVQRFGVEKIMQKCNFSSDVAQITGARKMKIAFCSLLMDEMPFTSTLFGIERDAMEYKGISYDVENDFHGIYFLYGIVGLVLFLVFLAYFVYLILWALIKNIQKYFTMDAGAYGMAFLLALANAYNTAGILRRPNASFYLSIILAVIYYLVKVRKYAENTNPKGVFALIQKKKSV
ncbi:MAG: O-antigen ligase family protein [Clostridia bacterium]|nr:O-antigen ligase family protein [Clostridia bacterium]